MPLAPEGVRVAFRLYPQAPFLLNDPAYVQEGEHVPRLEYSRTPEGYALIPATALRGWVRYWARRILLTLSVERGQKQKDAEVKVEGMLERLFGSTSQQSLLWFDDVRSAQEVQPHVEIFNAVDRFTGGVAEEKLYQVCAAECHRLEGSVYWSQTSLDRGYQGLFLLLVRDALEGDVRLGWGKGRGYGCFQVGIQVGEREIKTWHELKAFLQERDPLLFQEGLTALHAMIG